MTDDVKAPRRNYDASGRRARAKQTRTEIAEAAKRLFLERGYLGTTITDVAHEAHVSPETIYKGFGSKRALLDAAITTSIRGDTGSTPLRGRPVIDAIRQEPDPRRQLEMYGNLVADVNPRLVPLVRVMREAATVDPEARAALSQLESDRLAGMIELASLLARRGALRRGVSRPHATDVLWSLNSPELYELLVLERGWSSRRYADFVARQMTAELLG
ncbi:MAG: TetR/AcrR family transcriptional regulator [Solirubrobacterales bacterium]|nr:TetR/AcrR family transcriptional regulator [Solirubrobacterales bacterium]MBV9714732.1 TetR/AcrR family transcriptional regulator [Solirubrobacterales bacterium]